MTGRLEGKVAIITGTGGGQGRAAALRFAKEGAKVVGCDLKEEGNLETLEQVRAAGGDMTALHPLDLTDEGQVERLMSTTVETYGGLDILYNNAAAFRDGTIEDQSLEDWNFGLANEITNVWLAIKHAVPLFRARGGGNIINVGSIAGVVGTSIAGNLPGQLVHCVTKAGVIRMTEVAAIELAPLHVRVNTISPGAVLTPVVQSYLGERGDNELSKAFLEQSLIQRISTPDEIVNAAVFLGSDEASYITGANLMVDGGVKASGGVGQARADIAEIFARAFGSGS